MTALLRLALVVLLIGGVIGQFDLFIEPVEQAVQAGETAWFKIDIIEVGLPEAVSLETIEGCAVIPPVVMPSAGAVLGCELPVGTHTVVVTGTSTYHTESVTVTLTVEPWRVWLPMVMDSITGSPE